MSKDDEILQKLDLVIKLLGIIATQADLSKKLQREQIVILDKHGFRNKDIANIFGIKAQQVNNALLGNKKRK
ncbi:MAG: hypothetical protein WC312_00995 [Candidatus Omnitrophota bacterium]|jgi:hypothetical protein